MKRVLAALAIVVVLAVAAAVGFVLTFDINRYKSQLEAVVAERTGRSFAIDGEIRFVPAIVPTIALEGVRVGNVAWMTTGDLVAVNRIEARVALLPLIDRRIEVKRISVSGVTANLATNSQGEHNWTIAAPAAAPAAPQPAAIAAFAVEEVALDDLTVHYTAPASAADARVASAVIHSRTVAGVTELVQIAVVGATLEHRAGPRIVKLALDSANVTSEGATVPVAIALAGTYGAIPVAVSGTLGSRAQLFENAPMPFDLTGTVGGVKGRTQGQVGKPLDFAGLAARVELSADNAQVLGAVADVKLPPIAPVSFMADLAPLEQGVAFKQLAVKLGRSDLAGSGTLNAAGARPAIHADLRAERLDLTEFTPAPAKAAPGERLFSTEPLALGALRGVDFDGTLRIGTLIMHRTRVDQVQAQVALRGGQLKVTPASAVFASGKLDIALGLAALDVPKLEIELRGTGIMPAQLPQLAGKDLLRDGRTDLQFVLAGAGRSIADIMGSGNGRLLVRVGPGTLPSAAVGAAGADFVFGTLNSLNPLAGKDQGTTLECAVLNFDIKNGLASSAHGLGVRTDKLNVLGGGSIDLKTERIDIGATPKPRQGTGLNLAAIGDFVRLGGTLSKPTPVTDAQGAATAGLKVGAAFATGGLSVLAEGMFDRATSDDDVCAIAAGEKKLEAAPPPQAAQPAATNDADQSVLGKAADSTKNAVKGVGSAVKGVFKGLFGQ